MPNLKDGNVNKKRSLLTRSHISIMFVSMSLLLHHALIAKLVINNLIIIIIIMCGPVSLVVSSQPFESEDLSSNPACYDVMML